MVEITYERLNGTVIRGRFTAINLLSHKYGIVKVDNIMDPVLLLTTVAMMDFSGPICKKCVNLYNNLYMI